MCTLPFVSFRDAPIGQKPPIFFPSKFQFLINSLASSLKHALMRFHTVTFTWFDSLALSTAFHLSAFSLTHFIYLLLSGRINIPHDSIIEKRDDMF